MAQAIVPHKAVFYVRIDPQTMGHVKSCQLQVSFENKGIAEVCHCRA